MGRLGGGGGGGGGRVIKVRCRWELTLGSYGPVDGSAVDVLCVSFKLYLSVCLGGRFSLSIDVCSVESVAADPRAQ